MAKPSERKSDHIEVAPLDVMNVATSAALNRVGAGFVEGLFTGEVARQFLVAERGKMHMRGFHEAAAFGVRKTNQGDACYDRMCATGEFRQRIARIIAGAGLAQDLAVENNDGVGCDDDGWSNGARSDEIGFGVRQALDEIVWGFAGNGSFVHGRGQHGERETGVAKDVSASRGSGSENEFYGRQVAVRIQQEVASGKPVANDEWRRIQWREKYRWQAAVR